MTQVLCQHTEAVWHAVNCSVAWRFDVYIQNMGKYPEPSCIIARAMYMWGCDHHPQSLTSARSPPWCTTRNMRMLQWWRRCSWCLQDEHARVRVVMIGNVPEQDRWYCLKFQSKPVFGCGLLPWLDSWFPCQMPHIKVQFRQSSCTPWWTDYTIKVACHNLCGQGPWPTWPEQHPQCRLWQNQSKRKVSTFSL